MKLYAENISKSFGSLQILKNVNLAVDKKEIVTLWGASGAGKSTLLKILATFEKQDQGKVIINNQDISILKGNQLAEFRNKNIGFVFQENNLLEELTALENVCLPRFIRNDNKKETIEYAKELLKELNVDHRLDHRPSEMSGGEQQRVAIARALINSPEIIFADEPSGNLDHNNSIKLHEMFIKLRDKFQQTFIIVTHNPTLSKLSDRVLVIKDGKILD